MQLERLVDISLFYAGFDVMHISSEVVEDLQDQSFLLYRLFLFQLGLDVVEILEGLEGLGYQPSDLLLIHTDLRNGTVATYCFHPFLFSCLQFTVDQKLKVN